MNRYVWSVANGFGKVVALVVGDDIQRLLEAFVARHLVICPFVANGAYRPAEFRDALFVCWQRLAIIDVQGNDHKLLLEQRTDFVVGPDSTFCLSTVLASVSSEI